MAAEAVYAGIGVQPPAAGAAGVDKQQLVADVKAALFASKVGHGRGWCCRHACMLACLGQPSRAAAGVPNDSPLPSQPHLPLSVFDCACRRCAATRRATTSSGPRARSRAGTLTWAPWPASGREAASSARVRTPLLPPLSLLP